MGQLAPDYHAPFEVVDRDAMHRLRRYAGPGPAKDRIPVVLIPPLMVTSDVYDVAPDTSAVTTLAERGMDPFVVDFGSPEDQEGGLSRTLDDHVKTIDRAIDRARAITGRDVHLAGYSQGGMFAYQAAAYRKSRGIKSIVTFGAPVDLHRNVPAVRSSVIGAMVRTVEPAVMGILDRLEAVPGEVTSTGFKVLSTRKEFQQRLDFVKKLHDRNALMRREARRRFLGGAGFVAWPGPALRDFVDQFIVHNRMLSGGFVIDGRTLTLADLTCPMLCFIGLSDDMARPAAVRAIVRAAPDAKLDFLEVAAGHFGLVVGSRATQITWPTAAAWIANQEGKGERPAILDQPRHKRADLEHEIDDEPEGAGFDVEPDFTLFVDSIADTLRGSLRRISDVTASATDALDTVRYREPRLRRLAELEPSSQVSPALSLAEQAERTPAATFFLWQGRAFSYAEADVRVSNVARGLIHCDIRRGDRVAVLMGSRPIFLSMVTALSRLGAVPVLLPPDASPSVLRETIRKAGVRACATDPEFASLCVDMLTEPATVAGASARLERRILVLGGGGGARTLPPGVVDMEAIDPKAVKIPDTHRPNPGIGSDVALVLCRPSEDGGLRMVEVTNLRWALSALGAAASCTLKPDDTVYCAIPLHHPGAILVSVGSAIVGGSRLALGRPFSADTFASEVRRYGASVVFYAGEMTRALVNRPPSPQDRTLPVRLFAGSGMRIDLWRRMKERFDAGIMEFYASTSERVIIANASGEKEGAIGRPMPGCAELAIVRADPETGKPLRGANGLAERATVDEPGRLAARVEFKNRGPLVERGLFTEGDAWFVSPDVVRRDIDGDYWFVDSLAGMARVDGHAVSTRKVEDALYSLDEVLLASVYLVEGDLTASVVARGGLDRARLDAAVARLAVHEQPKFVLELEELPLTEGFRPRKRLLRAAGADRERAQRRWVRDDTGYREG